MINTIFLFLIHLQFQNVKFKTCPLLYLRDMYLVDIQRQSGFSAFL